MSYDGWRTSYKLEATWNTDPIPNVTTPTYWLGVTDEQAQALPEPIDRLEVVTPGPGSREATDTIRLSQHFRSKQVIGLQNAHLVYVCLGKITTSASGVYYVHSIAPAGNATTGLCADRPSVTIHSEATDSGGSATDISRHYTGCRVAILLLEQSKERVALTGTVDWIAGNATVWSHTSLSQAPTDFGSDGLYDWADTTITYNGNSIKAGLLRISVEIQQGTVGVYGQRSSGSNKPQLQTDAAVIGYSVELDFVPSALTMWQDALRGGTSAEKDLVIKFQNSANDYIQLTLTDSHPHHPDFPVPGAHEAMRAKVTLQPETLRVEVKDSVASYT